MRPQIAIEQFNYELLDDKIAKYPLANRDSSKLLIYKDSAIYDKEFRDIVDEIPANALMVFNNTKVIRARLAFEKPTGAQIEIFCLEPAYSQDVQTSFSATNEAIWCCIVGNSKKWKEGKLAKTVIIKGESVVIYAERLEISADSQTIRFTWEDSSASFGEVVDCLGQTPIPPYLNRESEEIDEERYQTVYSQHKGSVAAPTAGLHFTDSVMQKLKDKGIKTAFITLHVGAGTFKPVKSKTIDGHDMHVESFSASIETLSLIHDHQGPIIAVGTTSVRTLESLYWLGTKQISAASLKVDQWQPYSTETSLTYRESIKKLIDHLQENGSNQLNAQTAIMIAPSYQFRIVDALVTNFHQPQSTLLLLIAALIGDKWNLVYDHALTNNYRFLSYGDSSLLFNDEKKIGE